MTYKESSLKFRTSPVPIPVETEIQAKKEDFHALENIRHVHADKLTKYCIIIPLILTLWKKY